MEWGEHNQKVYELDLIEKTRGSSDTTQLINNK